VNETGFSKASVSVWVRDIILTETQKNKISERGRSVRSIEKRRVSRLFNEKQKKRVIIDEAQEKISNISLEDLRLVGTSLYLGEGRKTGGSVSVANSDPDIIKIMMRFFREICNVPEYKFRVHIHAFSHSNIRKTEKYWSEITGIPRRQFYKTYVKPSSASLQKRNTLPFGTVDVCICNTRLLLTILGWIEKMKKLVIKD
jgi:hypothetical protein